jgi:hypothetical protein
MRLDPTMSVAEAQPSNPRGDALIEELMWVHRMIRTDLGTVRRLADEVLAGLPAGEVRGGIQSLAASGPLWSLRLNCLYYCRVVHAHHHGESHLLFPAIRAAHPAMTAVVDRLEADHVAVAGMLQDIESAAADLVDGDTPQTRRRVVDALTALAERLLVHLDYEEEQLGPVLRAWDRWPWAS